MRSAKSGGSPSPSGGIGGKTCCPKGFPFRGPSRDLQAFVLTVQAEAPCLEELHVLCLRVTTPHRCTPLGQDAPLALQLPCWNAGHSVVPSRIVSATALPFTFCPIWNCEGGDSLVDPCGAGSVSLPCSHPSFFAGGSCMVTRLARAKYFMKMSRGTDIN